jgi:hypothetical protein
MGHEPSARTIGRTVVVASWLVALAVAGRPAWAAVLLGLFLVLVWASPLLLATNRRSPARGLVTPHRPVVEPREAGPAS